MKKYVVFPTFDKVDAIKGPVTEVAESLEGKIIQQTGSSMLVGVQDSKAAEFTQKAAAIEGVGIQEFPPADNKPSQPAMVAGTPVKVLSWNMGGGRRLN